MNYLKSKTIIFTVVTASGLIFTACNSNNSSDLIADTTNTTATFGASPNTKTLPDSAMATSAPADSSAIKNTIAKSDSTTRAKSSITKKKGKASVIIVEADKKNKPSADKSGVYNNADVQPKFSGGQSAIEDYVTSHIDYPESAIDDNKEGQISVAFVVNENGSISNVHTVGNKLGDGLDEEAARVISSMPKWTPGTVNGKAVKTRMTLPITFKMED